MTENKEAMKTRSSRKTYFLVYMMIFILITTVAIIKISGKELDQFAFKAVLVFSAALIIFTEIHRFRNFYEINHHSLIHSKGIFVKKTKRVDLLSVSDADSKQNPWQRLFDYGDVSVNLYSGGNAVPVKNINNPEKFVDFLEEKMGEKRTEEGGGGMKR
tara:strand:+ start:289 stop:765 length:477 start_codon:yes stop_codon:yes gene_type:complete